MSKKEEFLELLQFAEKNGTEDESEETKERLEGFIETLKVLRPQSFGGDMLDPGYLGYDHIGILKDRGWKIPGALGSRPYVFRAVSGDGQKFLRYVENDITIWSLGV